jgi:hypothetical protein
MKMVMTNDDVDPVGLLDVGEADAVVSVLTRDAWHEVWFRPEAMADVQSAMRNFTYNVISPILGMCRFAVFFADDDRLEDALLKVELRSPAPA